VETGSATMKQFFCFDRNNFCVMVGFSSFGRLAGQVSAFGPVGSGHLILRGGLTLPIGESPL
jgi:hypothetical protein